MAGFALSTEDSVEFTAGLVSRERIDPKSNIDYGRSCDDHDLTIRARGERESRRRTWSFVGGRAETGPQSSV